MKHERIPRLGSDFLEMTVLIKSFAAVLILSLITKGHCDCSLDNINIGTVRSGRVVQGKPEWKVTVINNCDCKRQIKLHCKGFQTVEQVDPKILLKNGDLCLLNNGNFLNGFASVSFSYAWDPPFLLLPASAISIGC